MQQHILSDYLAEIARIRATRSLPPDDDPVVKVSWASGTARLAGTDVHHDVVD